MNPETIQISPEMTGIVNRLIQSGEFQAPEEVVETALRQMAARLDEAVSTPDGGAGCSLADMLEEGLTDVREGRFTVLKNDDEIDAFVTAIGARANERARRLQ